MILAIALASARCPGQSLGKGRDQAPSYTQPAENLLIIVADIQRHLDDDIYRFPYAVDVTGKNVFRAALVRLANYETLYPGRLSDIVALAKAQAFEKLSGYNEAARNYDLARKSPDEAIRKIAGEGLERARKFDRVVNQPVDMAVPRTYERDMKQKIGDIDQLANEYKGTPHRALALLERERAQTTLAKFYLMFRFMQPFNTNDAIAQIKRNIDQNSNSKNLYLHHLLLGDLQFELAREYAILNDPEGMNFQRKAFDGFANSARAQYHIVEQADGFPEKLEGRAKIAALEAFVERIGDRAR
ncbi:MAG: hypothetical protein WCK47_06315 [bacterium]|nr:hypothetical protein [Candidatus Sumerlaeota bacterium]